MALAACPSALFSAPQLPFLAYTLFFPVTPSLKNYHLLPSVRGDMLAKLGRLEEAAAEFKRAATLTRNIREQKLLLDRARKIGSSKKN